jgi:hypothetical protein
MRVLCKLRLNYFGPRYWRGIDCVHNYLMKMQYPYKGILEILWALYHIQRILEG